eukprot:c28341_g2_i1 orf=586-2025(+)
MGRVYLLETFYPSLNRSKCCAKSICTECFLQVKPPQAGQPAQCPFCKTPNYAVEYRGAKTLEEKGLEQAEEQKVIEAKIRIRQKELQDEEMRMQLRDIGEDMIPVKADFSRQSFSNLKGFIAIESPTIRQNNSERDCELGEAMHRSSEQHMAVAQDYSELCAEESSEGIFSASISHSLARKSARSLVLPDRGEKFLWMNRDDGFNLDLEDIMEMEAILYSIEDQDTEPISVSQQNTIKFGSDLQKVNQDMALKVNPSAAILHSTTGGTMEVQGRRFVTGGLAGVITALAEQQVLGVDNALSQQIYQSDQFGHMALVHGSTSSVHAVDAGQFASAYKTPPRSCALPTRNDLEGEQKGMVRQEMMNETTYMGPEEFPFHDQDNWLAVSMDTDRGFSHLVEESQSSTSEWMMDHSSEAVEVGTSFSSSILSASELPWEAPDLPSEGSTAPNPVLPETFEEQMMLAMALSLAEARAQAKSRQV